MVDLWAGLEFGEVPAKVLQQTIKALQGSAADEYLLP